MIFIGVDMLCLVDVSDMERLPSPEQLRNKIIIKAKKFFRSKQVGTIAPKSDKDGKTQQEIKQSSPPSISKSGEINEDKSEPVLDEIDGQAISTPLAKPLFDMVNICEAVKFHSLSHSQKNGTC